MPLHSEIDQRSLAMHKLVAQKVRADIGLLVRARATLDRWNAHVSPRTFVYLNEWRNLMDSGLEAVLSVATEDSEHAAAMRQASLLACLLTNQERFALLKQWKAQHASQ